MNNNRDLVTIAILLSILFAGAFSLLTGKLNSLDELLIGVLPNFIASLLTFTALYIYLGPWKESVSNRTIHKQIDLLLKNQKSIRRDFSSREKNIVADVNQLLGFSLNLQKNGLYFDKAELKNMKNKLSEREQSNLRKIEELEKIIEKSKNEVRKSYRKQKIQNQIGELLLDNAYIKEQLKKISDELSIIQVSSDKDFWHKAHEKKLEELSKKNQIIEKLQTKKSEYEVLLKDMEELKVVASKEIEYKNKIQKLEGELSNVGYKLKSVNEKNEELMNKNTALEKRINSLKKQAHTHGEELQKL